MKGYCTGTDALTSVLCGLGVVGVFGLASVVFNKGKPLTLTE